MNPVQLSIGSELKWQMNGNTQIVISDHEVKKAGRSQFSLWSYRGHVTSGTNETSKIEASILAFDREEVGKALHNQLTKFDHPYVMRSLGYGKGSGDYSNYMFVALPVIHDTLGEWLQPSSGAGEMGRFTELFIDIICKTVKGLKALHDNGFYCPNLEGKHVAVNVVNGCATVKIWCFHASNSVKKKDRDWVRLKDLLYIAGNNNTVTDTDSFEIFDLFTKMKNGELKGLDILTHSALLTVKQKFENVLALNFNVSLHYKPKEPEQSTVQEQPSTDSVQEQSSTDSAQKHSSTASAKEQSTEETQESYNLEEYLDVNMREAERPEWIDGKRRTKKPTTFRKLLTEFRDILEHENEYVPQEMTMKITAKDRLNGVKELDLEHHVRKNWPESYFKMQVWARDPSAKL